MHGLYLFFFYFFRCRINYDHLHSAVIIRCERARTREWLVTLFIYLFLSKGDGPKSSFVMKVNLAFNLEVKVPESGGRVERHRIHVA